MGRALTYYCSTCNYKAITCAGRTATFSARLNTFVCLKCKEVMDIATHYIHRKPVEKDPDDPEPLMLIFRGKSTIEEVKSIMCNRCEGSDLKLCDTVEKPCPKCNTPLEIDRDGIVILGD